MLILGITAAIGGCGGTQGVPVINKSPNRQIPPQIVVGPADSIYTISWRFGLDYLAIAKWNGVKPPYDLKSGQRLSLRPGGSPTPVNRPAQVATRPLPPEPITRPAAIDPAPAPEPVGSGSQPQPSLSAPSRWQWPASGDLIAKYSPARGVNGLRIGGNPGAPIKATAAGDVVYVGEGLRGYGKLIIVKHTDKYLSAYAHNQRILVGEGERVNAGQQIAEMGSSGAEQTMLHFEIRVNGKPEDPLKYLKG